MKNIFLAIAALFIAIGLSSCYTTRLVSEPVAQRQQRPIQYDGQAQQPVQYGYDQPVQQQQVQYVSAPVQQQYAVQRPSIGQVILAGAAAGFVEGLMRYGNRYYRNRYPMFYREYGGSRSYYYCSGGNQYAQLYEWPGGAYGEQPYYANQQQLMLNQNGQHNYYDPLPQRPPARVEVRNLQRTIQLGLGGY